MDNKTVATPYLDFTRFSGTYDRDTLFAEAVPGGIGAVVVRLVSGPFTISNGQLNRSNKPRVDLLVNFKTISVLGGNHFSSADIDFFDENGNLLARLPTGDFSPATYTDGTNGIRYLEIANSHNGGGMNIIWFSEIL